MNRWRIVLGGLAACVVAWNSDAVGGIPPIPAQADMAAEVIVSGHTSTERNIAVVNIGKQIPNTFGMPRLANVDGFSWYVSRHFALRTDYPEAEAIHKLKLLELAYPHYVAFLGMPADSDSKRVAVVFGSTYQSVTEVMMADNFKRGPYGGGEAMYYNNVAYCFPTGAYHNRYILLHETGHAFQFAVAGRTQSMPFWYVEGFADGISNHLYEPENKRLTFFVMNTWRGHDWMRDGLNSHAANPSWPGGSRGQNVLAVQFFMHDPMRFARFQLWQEEMFRIDPEGDRIQAESQRLLNEIFGPAEDLRRDYMEWVSELKPVIQRVDGAWRLGVADYSIGDSQSDKMNRVVLDLPPGEPLDKLYGFEKIGPEPTALIGTVACGTAEPVVGCLIAYSAAPAAGSEAGLGLGVIDAAGIDPFAAGMREPAAGSADDDGKPGSLNLLVSGGTSFVVDGEWLGLGRHELPLPDDVARALATGACRVGITARLRVDELRVALRVETGRPADEPVLHMRVPLTPRQHRRLLDRPVALLARQAACSLNVSLDASRRYHDPGEPAPANPWRSEVYGALRRVVKASWRLGEEAPSSLLKMRGTLYGAARDGSGDPAGSLQRFNTRLAGLARDIAGTDRDDAGLALADLAGLAMELTHATNETRDIVAVMSNDGSDPVNGLLTFSVISSNGVTIADYTNSVTIPARSRIRIGQHIPREDGDAHRGIAAVARLRGVGNPVVHAETARLPSPWLSMRLDPSYASAGATGVAGHAVFTGPVQMGATGDVTFRVRQQGAVQPDAVTRSVTVKAGESLAVPFSFAWKDTSMPISVEAEAHLLHINEQIMLKDVLEIVPESLP